MEELEKNETSTQAEENTVSLASAQALADALAKIEAYTPTTWVDNSSPDIDAEHLNKPEQAIKRVTDALNSAVDVIKDLQSQVTKNSGAISDVNNNLSKYDRKKLNDGDNLNVKLGPYGSASNNIVGSLLNKPTQVLNGEVTIDWYPSNDNSNYGTQILRHTRDNTINIYFRAKKGSVDNWSEWINLATKNDLGNLITHRKTTGNTSDSGNITINRPEGYSLIGAYINSIYVRLSIPTVYQKTIIVRCFDENMSPLKNTLVEVISLWIKKDISY